MEMKKQYKAALTFAVDDICKRWKADVLPCKDGKTLAETVLSCLDEGKNTEAAVHFCCFFMYPDYEPDLNRLRGFQTDMYVEGVLCGFADFMPLPYFLDIQADVYFLLNARFLCGKLWHEERSFTPKERYELLKNIVLLIAFQIFEGGDADGQRKKSVKRTKPVTGQATLLF